MTEPDKMPSIDSSVAGANGNVAGLAADGLKRRRLLKIGASGTSVALTLTSRPARAWHCNSTSAWGSAQLAPTTSTTARNTAHETGDECWSISEWVNNTSHGSLGLPWKKLGCSTTSQINSYTVGTLYGSKGGIPDGLLGSNKLMDKLRNGTLFQKSMLVARLNANLIPSVQTCLLDNMNDQLTLMAKGSYQPPNLPGVTWNKDDIVKYLSSNWMAQP